MIVPWMLLFYSGSLILRELTNSEKVKQTLIKPL